MKTIIHLICPAIRTGTRKLSALAALSLIFVTGLHQRAEGAGGNTGGGTIFYTHACCRTMWAMNSDGSNQTHFGTGTYGPPSMSIYGGYRYFLHTMPTTPQEFYPNGDPRVEVVALRSDWDWYTNDNSTTKVQLTNDITLQTFGDGLYSLHWVPGGQKISFKARRWSGSTVSEAGIYTASLQFGPDGSITGLAAQPAAPAIPFALDADFWPSVRTYCWDPTGTKVAYENSPALYALRLADLLGSPHQTIYNGWAHTPQWSPDGTKIAFSNINLSIMTINPNGTHLTEIIRRTSTYTFDRPFFSPTGSHIVCYGMTTTAPLDDEIFRVTSNGNSLTNLTNTPSTAEYPMGWR
jgi:hypothetical protein